MRPATSASVPEIAAAINISVHGTDRHADRPSDGMDVTDLAGYQEPKEFCRVFRKPTRTFRILNADD